MKTKSPKIVSTCKKHGETEFYDYKRKDGKQFKRCCKCSGESSTVFNKVWKAEHPEKTNEYMKNWLKSNRGKWNDYQRTRYRLKTAAKKANAAVPVENNDNPPQTSAAK